MCRGVGRGPGCCYRGQRGLSRRGRVRRGRSRWGRAEELRELPFECSFDVIQVVPNFAWVAKGSPLLFLLQLHPAAVMPLQWGEVVGTAGGTVVVPHKFASKPVKKRAYLGFFEGDGLEFHLFDRGRANPRSPLCAFGDPWGWPWRDWCTVCGCLGWWM